MSEVNITNFLKEHGLYAERSYNTGSIKIREIEGNEVAFELDGMELAQNSSPEETLKLIKDKLNSK